MLKIIVLKSIINNVKIWQNNNIELVLYNQVINKNNRSNNNKIMIQINNKRKIIRKIYKAIIFPLKIQQEK